MLPQAGEPCWDKLTTILKLHGVSALLFTFFQSKELPELKEMTIRTKRKNHFQKYKLKSMTQNSTNTLLSHQGINKYSQISSHQSWPFKLLRNYAELPGVWQINTNSSENLQLNCFIRTRLTAIYQRQGQDLPHYLLSCLNKLNHVLVLFEQIKLGLLTHNKYKNPQCDKIVFMIKSYFSWMKDINDGYFMNLTSLIE